MKRGYYGIGIFNSKTKENIGTLWRSALNLGADFIFTIGRRYKYECTDTNKTWKSVPLYNYQDFDDFKKHLPYDCKLVAVELNERARNLKNYIHPERCIYLLGAEDNGVPQYIIEECHDLIMIDSNLCMNVAVTGSIVMYDRIVKAS